ncbi:MAG: PAS domain S-box protein [Oscillatoriales cyanobacterium SM2_1_8]|nr:PAS domain S-box protein [Oscillatoriales cyanobacterium SM2_1_8]
MISVAVPCREHHARAFQSSPSAIVITTLAEGRILEANDSFSRLTGYRHEELRDRTTEELGLWHDPGDRQAMAAQLREQGCLRNVEFAFRTRDGQVAIGLFSAEFLAWDGEPALIATVNDITDYKRVQNQLKAALERDRLLGEIALRIRRSLELSEILTTTTAEVRQVLQVDRVFVGWRDEETGEGRIGAEACDPRFPSMRNWVLPTDKVCAATAMFTTDRAIAIDDAQRSDFFEDDPDFRAAFCVQAVLIAPIWQGGRFLGVLGVHQCSGPALATLRGGVVGEIGHPGGDRHAPSQPLQAGVQLELHPGATGTGTHRAIATTVGGIAGTERAQGFLFAGGHPRSAHADCGDATVAKQFAGQAARRGDRPAAGRGGAVAAEQRAAVGHA